MTLRKAQKKTKQTGAIAHLFHIDGNPSLESGAVSLALRGGRVDVGQNHVDKHWGKSASVVNHDKTTFEKERWMLNESCYSN